MVEPDIWISPAPFNSQNPVNAYRHPVSSSHTPSHLPLHLSHAPPSLHSTSLLTWFTSLPCLSMRTCPPRPILFSAGYLPFPSLTTSTTPTTSLLSTLSSLSMSSLPNLAHHSLSPPIIHHPEQPRYPGYPSNLQFPRYPGYQCPISPKRNTTWSQLGVSHLVSRSRYQ